MLTVVGGVLVDPEMAISGEGFRIALSVCFIYYVYELFITLCRVNEARLDNT